MSETQTRADNYHLAKRFVNFVAPNIQPLIINELQTDMEMEISVAI
jgi:hypothetical protein